MISIALVSPRPGTGKTTIAVNLAAGLVRRGFKVLLYSADQVIISNWLGVDFPQNKDLPVIKHSHMGFDVLYSLPKQVQDTVDLHNYDYFLTDTANQEELPNIVADRIICCTDFMSDNETELILNLNTQIKNTFNQELNLIIPSKIKTKEWDNNTRSIFALADELGYERIADLIPYWERIHNLPLEGKNVWDLSQQNLHDAFDRLIEQVID